MKKQILLPTAARREMVVTFKSSRCEPGRALTSAVNSNRAQMLRAAASQRGEPMTWRLVLTAYQRSFDANLGLPADIYHLYLISRQIDLPLRSITLNLGNVHIYENNIQNTSALIEWKNDVRFKLNVF